MSSNLTTSWDLMSLFGPKNHVRTEKNSAVTHVIPETAQVAVTVEMIPVMIIAVIEVSEGTKAPHSTTMIGHAQNVKILTLPSDKHVIDVKPHDLVAVEVLETTEGVQTEGHNEMVDVTSNVAETTDKKFTMIMIGHAENVITQILHSDKSATDVKHLALVAVEADPVEADPVVETVVETDAVAAVDTVEETEAETVVETDAVAAVDTVEADPVVETVVEIDAVAAVDTVEETEVETVVETDAVAAVDTAEETEAETVVETDAVAAVDTAETVVETDAVAAENVVETDAVVAVDTAETVVETDAVAAENVVETDAVAAVDTAETVVETEAVAAETVVETDAVAAETEAETVVETDAVAAENVVETVVITIAVHKATTQIIVMQRENAQGTLTIEDQTTSNRRSTTDTTIDWGLTT